MNKAQRDGLEKGLNGWGPFPYEVADPQPVLLEGWVTVIVTRGRTRWEVDLQPNGEPWIRGVAGKK